MNYGKQWETMGTNGKQANTLCLGRVYEGTSPLKDVNMGSMGMKKWEAMGVMESKHPLFGVDAGVIILFSMLCIVGGLFEEPGMKLGPVSCICPAGRLGLAVTSSNRMFNCLLRNP